MLNQNTDNHKQLQTVITSILSAGRCSLNTLENTNQVGSKIRELSNFITEKYAESLLRVNRHNNPSVRNTYARDTAHLLANLLEVIDLIFEYGEDTTSIFLNKLERENSRMQNHCKSISIPTISTAASSVSSIPSVPTTVSEVEFVRGKYKEDKKWVYMLKVISKEESFFVDTKFTTYVISSKNKQTKISNGFVPCKTESFRAINRILTELEETIAEGNYTINNKLNKFVIYKRGKLIQRGNNV